MTEKVLYWGSLVFSALALLLLVVNAALINGNRGLQMEVNNRQASINSASNLTALNQNLAQALAEIAVKNNDKAIRELLSSQGISITKPETGKATATAKTRATTNEEVE